MSDKDKIAELQEQLHILRKQQLELDNSRQGTALKLAQIASINLKSKWYDVLTNLLAVAIGAALTVAFFK